MIQHLPHALKHVFHDWRVDAALLGALLALFAVLATIVTTGGPTDIDRRLALGIQGLPGTRAAFQLASDVGGGMYGFYVVPALTAAVLAAFRQWRLVALVAIVVALHYVLISPKLLIVAHRPSPLLGVEGAGGLESFPSGHVEWATSFYGLLAYMIARRRPALRVPAVAGFVLIVAATMMARIELGRHWPIDTLAGLAVGLVAVRILMRAHEIMEWYGSFRPAPAEAVAPSVS